jgi:hypothetical protein
VSTVFIGSYLVYTKGIFFVEDLINHL